jgi:hypothetical protein
MSMPKGIGSRKSQPAAFALPPRALTHGFHQLAHEYLRAYYDLPERQNISWPKYFVFCHSIECVLKAFLAAQGMAQTELINKFGHDLEKLLDAVTKKGLALDPSVRSEIAQLTAAHKGYWARFPMEKSEPVPVINRDQYEPAVEGLFKVVDDALGIQLSHAPSPLPPRA